MNRALLLAGATMVVAVFSCQPPAMGEPLLEITAKPPEINDQGEETTIKVVATDGAGKVGQGKITITSEAGSLKDGPTFDLDQFGTVKTQFSCAIAADMYCKDSVQITATWITADGRRANAITRVLIPPPPPPPWEADVIWDVTSSTISCSGMGPPALVPCTGNMCAHGFTCVDGSCVLNGGGGGLQYTLRMGQSVDLDLHVVEPLADAGVCETFWGNSNRTGSSSCGAKSSLDLDSNASCNLDNVNIENIIYATNLSTRPPPGTYIGRVDLWASCAASTPIKWELQVRAGRISRYYCGQFLPSEADRGGAGSGQTISTITIP